MDTPDKAAGLADWQVADAVNKVWLVSSAELRHRLESSSSLETSIRRSSCQSYGSTQSVPRLRNLLNFKRHPNNQHNVTNTSAYTINGHLYDNISYAEAPQWNSLSAGATEAQKKLLNKSTELTVGGGDNDTFCNGKFRLWLATFVLLGITLANYSRNALSLAALGMLAKNAINRELINNLTTTMTSNYSLISAPLNDDHSCPLVGRLINNTQQLELPNDFLANNPQLGYDSLGSLPSISQRVESGELVDWTLGQQGLVSAAGSVGNLLIAIPLARLGEIHGPKWIVFVALLGATLQAALMPVVATQCAVWLVIVFQLIFNGLTYGADCVAYTLFAHWLAPTELAFFVSCLIICYQLGAMLSSLITTKILSAGLAWSWCFYAPAILCGIWTLIWALIGASEPELSGLISKRELHYLSKWSKIAQLKPRYVEQTHSERIPAGAQPISWWKLARDPNIWAIIGVKFTLRWYFSAHSALMPTYLSIISHLSVSTIGLMSLIQSLIGLFAGLLMGYLTKSLINNSTSSQLPFNMSLISARKCFQSIVQFGLALSLLVFIAYDCNQWVTIISLTVGVLCLSFHVAAAVQLPLDMSPTHCGLITSITNTLALGQALGAPLSGLILSSGGGGGDRYQWRIVWALASGLNLISGLLFILLVDSKPRDYSKQAEDEQQQPQQGTC